MIDALDSILADLIQSRVPALAGPTQVGFAPPDDDWRTALVTANEERLNVFLYDLRENLKLRSNERRLEAKNGWYSERRDPPILNCMYLITAWSPVTPALNLHPSIDEHKLLYSVAQVLFQKRSLLVADVYRVGVTIPSGNTLTSVPTRLRDEELPIEVAHHDASQELLDFWNTMKGDWRPGLKVTVALPVFPVEPDFESPMVTTLIGDYRQTDHPGSAEVLLSFGGQVVKGSSNAIQKGVYVKLIGLNPPAIQIVDQHVITQDDGRFLFSRLPAGQYRLRAILQGEAPYQRDMDLPSESGEYDLHFP